MQYDFVYFDHDQRLLFSQINSKMKLKKKNFKCSVRRILPKPNFFDINRQFSRIYDDTSNVDNRWREANI